MIDNGSELRKLVGWALICGIAYAVCGPVGLAVVAVVALLRTSKE